MKKRIENQITKIVSMVRRIEEYNEYIEDNTYSTGYGYGSSNLSFNAKLHGVWLRDSDVEDYIDKQGITGKRKKKILKEFDDDRMSGIFNHFCENSAESFIEDIDNGYYDGLEHLVDKKDIGFYGRGGGHLCLGLVSNFLLEIGDTEVGNYPIYTWKGEIVNTDLPIEELIAEFKDSLGVTTQKEVYEELRAATTNGDLKDYYDNAIERQAIFEKLEKTIEEFKENANKYCHEELYYEIDQFIEDNYSQKMAIELAEAGDYSKMDSIKTVTEAEVMTNRNAVVPKDKAIELLNAVCAGINVVGQKVGHYTVNKVKVKPNDTYIKIGCHLFSIRQTQLSLQV